MFVLRTIILREWHRMTSRRIYLAAAVILPLFLLMFMTTVFGNGQMEHLPIGIVDADNSAVSRSIVRHIEAVPTFNVAFHFADDAEARAAIRKKEIYGYLSIPSQFEESIRRGDNATLCYYYHYALLAVGGEVMSAFETALIPVRIAPIKNEAVALGAAPQRIESFLLPINADNHALYNPSLDYAVYLALPIYYIMLQIVVLLVTLYAVGSERKSYSMPVRNAHGASGETSANVSQGAPHGSIEKRVASPWLCVAEGNIFVAVVGKLLPYTLIFSSVALLANVVFFYGEHIPFAGSMWLMTMTTVLFIVATQSVAVILYSLFPLLSMVISVVSMVGSLGATLSGLTFPLEAMSPLVQYVAQLFPVRHFVMAIQRIVYFDGNFDVCWPMLAVLCVFPLFAVALLPRLRMILLTRPYDTLE